MIRDRDEKNIGCFANFQKWFILIVNVILCILGLAQVGLGCYIVAAGTEGLGFASAVFKDNDSAVKFLLVFGAIIVFIAVMGCCGAKRKSKLMLWVYAFILFFLIMGQSVGVVVVGFSVTYGNAIFESLWKTLSAETIEDIEDSYECCSFNGEFANMTWAEDAADWTSCTAENDWDPMETCWGKFESSITENFDCLYIVGAVVLGAQVITYFCTHYVVGSIAKAEGEDKKFY